ncbi:MAG: type II toxin-antitoxin system VapC family toxin [Methanobacterium sp.]
MDSSFFIASVLKRDQWHNRVLKILPEINKEEKITSILVLSEAVTLAGSLGGGKKGTLLYNYIVDNHEVAYLDKDLSFNSMETFLKYDGVLSFADSVSLEIMQLFGADTIVSFDSDFDKVKGIKRIH